MIFDTIAAISTPRGKGGVAMIRISGADAAAIVARVFAPRGGGSQYQFHVSLSFGGDLFQRFGQLVGA